ncbi:MAG: YqiA/YcfP family alpha/beta fold hydrolase [Porticoccaceae bacterium]|nr:YqiA/YcfP family alpha/beta fold hydrolase [Porticoccaceae bacterium]
MSILLYLHGFNSSPQSKKAIETEQWMRLNAPHISYCCPQLSPYASEVMGMLRPIIEAHLPQPVYLIGSSMGGFFATCLAEQYNLRAVLINPAVNPGSGLHSWLGENSNFITGEKWIFKPEHIEEYSDLDPQDIKRQQNYKLRLQTGDEVLDYRHAQRRYRGCSIETEVGGDHSFVDYQRHISANLEFLTHV